MTIGIGFVVLIFLCIFVLKMETFKDIIGYEGHYKISDLGNVKSLKRTSEKIVSQRKSGAGYYQTMLCLDSKKSYTLTHRLVAIAFIPNPENKEQVNHKNGIKTDNRVSNLEWCTKSENQIHAFKTGLQPHAKGEQRGKVCKLKWIDVQIIKARLKYGAKNKDLAKEFGVNPVTISNIKTGAIWAD